MFPDADLSALMETVRELVSVTESARDCAVARDFEGLSEAMKHKESLVKILQSQGDLFSLAPDAKRQVGEALNRVQEVDTEIRKALENEMVSDSAALKHVAFKAKALSAYERILPHARRFDRQK